MADEPKINFPKMSNGSLSTVGREETASKEPKMNFPAPPKQSLMQQKLQEDQEASNAMWRGLTFGLSDRARAAIRSGKYEDNLNDIQAERDAYRENHPVGSMVNEMAGGLFSGGAVSNGLKAIGARLLPQVVNYAKGVGMGPMAARVGQVAAEGALQGEAAHQGEQAYGQVGTGLGKGAALGAGVGLAGTAAAKVVGTGLKAGQRIGQRVALAAGAVKPERFANSHFNESLANQGLSPEDIQVAMKYLRGDDLQLQGPTAPGHDLPDMRPPIRVADALPKGTLGTVKRGIRSSERATSDVSEALKNRNAEQGMRLQNNASETLSDNVDSSAAQEALQLQRAAAAKPHYEAAYRVGTIDDPIIDQWIKDRKVNSRLFKELETNLKENASQGMGEGRPMSAVMDVDKEGNFIWKTRPSIEDMDTLKKHIDAKITKLWNPGKMKYDLPSKAGEQDAQQLINQRDDIVKLIDGLTPDGKGGSHYANARKAFADDSELIDAHRAGQSIMRTRPEDVARQFDKYTGKPELQDQFRAGISSSVKDLIDKADTEGGSAIVRKLYGSKGMQKKLEYVMGNESTRNLFNRNMTAEKVMVDTQKELAPKTSGNDLLSDAEGFSLPLAAVHALSGRFGASANQLGRFATGSIGGMAPEVGDQLAKLALMTPEEFAVWQAAQRAAEGTVGSKVRRGVGALGSLALDGVIPSLSGQAGRISDQKTGSKDDYEDY